MRAKSTGIRPTSGIGWVGGAGWRMPDEPPRPFILNYGNIFHDIFERAMYDRSLRENYTDSDIYIPTSSPAIACPQSSSLGSSSFIIASSSSPSSINSAPSNRDPSLNPSQLSLIFGATPQLAMQYSTCGHISGQPSQSLSQSKEMVCVERSITRKAKRCQKTRIGITASA